MTLHYIIQNPPIYNPVVGILGVADLSIVLEGNVVVMIGRQS